MHIHQARLREELFSLGKWYAEFCAKESGETEPWITAKNWLFDKYIPDTLMCELS
jgi:hypothetical protein